MPYRDDGVWFPAPRIWPVGSTPPPDVVAALRADGPPDYPPVAAGDVELQTLRDRKAEIVLNPGGRGRLWMGAWRAEDNILRHGNTVDAPYESSTGAPWVAYTSSPFEVDVFDEQLVREAVLHDLLRQGAHDLSEWITAEDGAPLRDPHVYGDPWVFTEFAIHVEPLRKLAVQREAEIRAAALADVPPSLAWAFPTSTPTPTTRAQRRRADRAQRRRP